MPAIDYGKVLYLMQPFEWRFKICRNGLIYTIWAKQMGDAMCAVPRLIRWPWSRDMVKGKKSE